MSDPVRLDRRVTQLCGCSPAEAEQYIRNGWVTVDGVVVEAPQHRVTDEDVQLDPEARVEPVEPATILLNKPAGLNALDDPSAAAALVTPATHWTDDPSGIRVLQRHFQRLTPLVPLDPGASGLMVLTQDGRVWRRLTEDADEIEHEYLVEVRGEMASYGLGWLKHGLSYNGVPLPKCSVSWQNETRLRFAGKRIRPGQLPWMCEQVGLAVVSIRRLRIGKVPIGKGPEGAMPAGMWRYLPVGEKF
jgi:23S rRNA pseudouridine2604 synthase